MELTNLSRMPAFWHRNGRRRILARMHRGIPSCDVRVDIKFDTNDPVKVCLRKHLDNYGRLHCYVYKSGVKEKTRI